MYLNVFSRSFSKEARGGRIRLVCVYKPCREKEGFGPIFETIEIPRGLFFVNRLLKGCLR